MKKYRYCFNSSKEPLMEGNIKETSRLLKDVTKYNKPFNNYMHLYKLENKEYIHVESKCLNFIIKFNEAYKDVKFKQLP